MLPGSRPRGAKPRALPTGSDDPFTRMGGAGVGGASSSSLKRAGMGLVLKDAASPGGSRSALAPSAA